MPTILSERFGAVVRDLRKDAGLSQEQFAARCGLHRTYIGFIERGEKSVTIETAQKLAVAFGVSLSAMFARMESQDVPQDAQGGSA